MHGQVSYWLCAFLFASSTTSAASAGAVASNGYSENVKILGSLALGIHISAQHQQMAIKRVQSVKTVQLGMLARTRSACTPPVRSEASDRAPDICMS